MVEGERSLTVTVRQRGALRGPKACAAADHPLAAQAGMAVLQRGGSAADAAVAMGAVMVVVQPYYSHLGGDLFALTFDARTREVEALNSSGPAPASAAVAAYRALGSIPAEGGLAVTVPGCVDGWWQLHRRAGRLPWAELLEPATAYARDGFPASRQLAAFLGAAADKVRPREYFNRLFGHVSRGGARVTQPELGRTLGDIAAGGADAFYGGEVARACREWLVGQGAAFSAEDWRGPARWERPVSAPFAGATVFSQPPPSQGFVLPLALKLYVELLDGRSGLADCVLQHAALAQAFQLRATYAGDPDTTGFDAQRLIDDTHLGSLITPGAPVPAGDGDTTYLLAIDAQGNAVSLIQSLFAGGGSGVLVPGTGVIMNNRMCGFTLREGHPNVLAPGKRPMHTLHSYIATGPEGELRVVGGTPGAMQQPQTNLAVLDAILRRGMDVQDALDEPRWSMGAFAPFRPDYREVLVERHSPDLFSPAFRDAEVDVEDCDSWTASMGRAYVAVVDEGGIAAASDVRGEGLAIVM